MKIYVGSMMDWTDWGRKARQIQSLSRFRAAMLYRMQYRLDCGTADAARVTQFDPKLSSPSQA